MGATAGRKPVPRTLLITDLVDSTEINRKIGDVRNAALWSEIDRTTRDLLQRFDGREIDKTDGFLLIFDRPIDAVAYALRYHESLAELEVRLALGVALRMRVGIHLGEVLLRKNSPADVRHGAKRYEIEGLAKPVCARIMSLALGGQTLLSAIAFDLAQAASVGSDALPVGVKWQKYGQYALKGAGEPMSIGEVGIEGRAPLKPPPDGEKAHRVPPPTTPAAPIPAPAPHPPRPAPAPDVPFERSWDRSLRIAPPPGLTDASTRRFAGLLGNAVQASAAAAAACDALLAPAGEARQIDGAWLVEHEPVLRVRPEWLLAPAGRVDADSLLWLCWRLTAALDALHRAQAVHGGIHCASLCFDRAGRAKLADAGIAPAYEAVAPAGLRSLACLTDPDASSPGARWGLLDDGTPLPAGWITPFMAHELLEGRGRLNPRSDQFALGALLHLSATGEHPFGADAGDPSLAVYFVLRRRCLSDVRQDWLPIFDRRERKLSLPGDRPLLACDDLLGRLLASRSEDRFGSAADALALLTPVVPAAWKEAASELDAALRRFDRGETEQFFDVAERWRDRGALPKLWRETISTSVDRLRSAPALASEVGPASVREVAARTKAAIAAARPRPAAGAGAPVPAKPSSPTIVAPVVSAPPVAVGIDLGTTYSVIAHVGASGPVLLPDAREAERFRTPSVVHVGVGGAMVGQPVEDLLLDDPSAPAVRFVKLHMGRTAALLKDPHGREWRPEGLAALILRKLRRDAKARTARNLSGAVVTVPASFDDAQRRATLNAALLAGVPVIDLVEEPVAAAVYYGATSAQRDATLLVYDLGGGTFDATLLRVAGDALRVLATDGETDFGGKRFDETIMERIADAFRQRHGFDPLRDAGATVRLRRQAEGIKIALSRAGRDRVVEPVVLNGLMVEFALTRAEFEAGAAPLIDRTVAVCERMLAVATMDWPAVDQVMLAGGSSLMPLVERRMRAASGKADEGLLRRQPDAAIAYGAALLAQQRGEASTAGRADSIARVTNRDLGLRVQDPRSGRDEFVPLIPRNTPYPASARRTFYSRREDESRLVVALYQRRSDDARPTRLGKFAFHLANPRKRHPLDVTVAYDERGLVRVTARDPETGREASREFDDADVTELYGLEDQQDLVRNTPLLE